MRIHQDFPILFGSQWPRGYAYLGRAFLSRAAVKLDQVRAGTGNCRMLCIGESNTRGVGAGTGANLTIDEVVKSWPKKLADYLTTAGIPSAHNGFCAGSMGTGGTDGRITLGTGWTNSATGSIGGAVYRETGGTTNPFTFQPADQYNQIVVGYNRSASQDTFTIDNGGAVLATINANGTPNAQLSQVINTTLSSAAINFKRTLAGVGSVSDCAYIETRNTTSPRLEIVNAGWSGAGFVNQISTGVAPWVPPNAIATYAPDITIIADGANDQLDQVTESQYKAALQTVIAKAIISGDVILVASTPYDPAQVAGVGGEAQRLVQARWMKDVSKSNHLPFVDLSVLMPPYAAANAMGWMGNGFHPSEAGYTYEASLIARALLV